MVLTPIRKLPRKLPDMSSGTEMSSTEIPDIATRTMCGHPEPGDVQRRMRMSSMTPDMSE